MNEKVIPLKKVIKWHELFGLNLEDLFFQSNFQVKTEFDTSNQAHSYVDVLIISKSEGKPLEQVPDGFEFLKDYNILTYKSLNQSLDQWAIVEILGHYVSYRKIVSPKEELLPQSRFQVFAVCTSYPQKLLGSEKKFGKEITKIKPGVYKFSSPLIGSIIILVLSRMAKQTRNALWQLFSGRAQGFEYGDAHYKWHVPADKSLLYQLYQLYLTEEVKMPYTFEEFHRDYTIPFIESLPYQIKIKGMTPDERLKGLTPHERLKGLAPNEVFQQFTPHERLKGLAPNEVFQQFTPHERLKGLAPNEVFKQFTPHERLKGLAPNEVFQQFTQAEIEAYLRKLKKKTH